MTARGVLDRDVVLSPVPSPVEIVCTVAREHDDRRAVVAGIRGRHIAGDRDLAAVDAGGVLDGQVTVDVHLEISK